MQKRSRSDRLKNMISERLKELELLMLASYKELSDEEFEELKAEAIMLRETLKML